MSARELVDSMITSEAGRRVLFVQFSSSLDGAGLSGLAALNALRQGGFETFAVFSRDGPLIKLYELEGHQTKVIEHKNWLRRDGFVNGIRDLLREFERSFKFVKDIRSVRPSVVYVNTVSSVSAVVAAKLTGVPVVWHLRELFSDVGGELRSHPILRFAVRWFVGVVPTALIANSIAVRNNVLGDRRLGACRVIYNSVDEGFLAERRTQAEARAALSINVKGKLVGIPGTLRPMKGHIFAFRSLKRLLDDGTVSGILVSGDGTSSYKATLFAEVKRLGIADVVHFVGVVTDMPAFYRACDVICVPSRSEPFGRVVIEAVATGSAVVASKVGGIIEAADGGQHAVLVPADDSDGFMCAVKHSVLNPSLPAEPESNVLQSFKSRYSSGTYGADILAVVRRMVPE